MRGTGRRSGDDRPRAPRGRTGRRAAAHAVVRVRPAVVQARGLLRDPHPGLLRLERRRLGRPARHPGQARLPAVARRRLHLAAADVRKPAARRRLRHRGLLCDPPRLRHGRRLPQPGRGRARARDPDHCRPRRQPHVGRPSVVPGVALQSGQPEARLVRLVGHRHPLPRRADHLRRHRAVQLDVGPGRRRLLLAPLLLAPARPELRQPRGAGGDARRPALLARRRHRRLPPRRRPVPLRARRHERREPPRDARLPEAPAHRGRREVPGPRAPRRGEPVARGRGRVLRRGRRVPHGLPLPGHAAHVHGAAPRGRHADLRDPRPHPADPGQRAVGPVPPQPRRVDARDGHRRGARLHVRGVRRRTRA